MEVLTTTRDEAAIRALIADRARAIFDGDADRAVSSLAANVVSYDLAPPLQHVGAAARDPDALRDWLDTWDGPVRITDHDVVVEVDGDLALAFGFSHMTGTKRDGEAIDLWSRFTLGLKRRDGGWQVIHDHASVPFLMDGSGRAALDLKP